MNPALALVAVAYLLFGATSVVLSVIDIRSHRLPDRIVLPGVAAAVLLLGAASLLSGEPMRLVGVLGGAVTLFVLYLAIRLVAPRGMGGGDVKLAALVGAHLGYLGTTALLLGAVGGFVLGGLFGAILIVTRRATRATAVPFGPWMLAGAWTAILLTLLAPDRMLPAL